MKIDVVKKKIISWVLIVCFVFTTMIILSACKDKKGNYLPQISEANYAVLKQAITDSQSCENYVLNHNYYTKNNGEEINKFFKFCETDNSYITYQNEDGTIGNGLLKDNNTNKLKLYNWGNVDNDECVYLYETNPRHQLYFDQFENKSLYETIDWSDSYSLIKFIMDSTKQEFVDFLIEEYTNFETGYKLKNNKKFYYFTAYYDNEYSKAVNEWQIVLNGQNKIIEQNVEMSYEDKDSQNEQSIKIRATIDYNQDNFISLPDLPTYLGGIDVILETNYAYICTYNDNRIKLTSFTYYIFDEPSSHYATLYGENGFKVKEDGAIIYVGDNSSVKDYLPDSVNYAIQDGNLWWYLTETEYIVFVKTPTS